MGVLQILEDAKRDHDLHHAACNLVKKPGNIYYLYRRQSGQAYFSLLSPQEWGASCPHEFLDAYRLEYDQSWTPLKDLKRRTDEINLVDRIINHQLALTDASNPLGLPQLAPSTRTAQQTAPTAAASTAAPPNAQVHSAEAQASN